MFIIFGEVSTRGKGLSLFSDILFLRSMWPSCHVWHSILAFYLVSFLTYSDILSGILSGFYSDLLFWHSMWLLFWHSFWDLSWHSTWHPVWHLSIGHSVWHSLWHEFGSKPTPRPPALAIHSSGHPERAEQILGDGGEEEGSFSKSRESHLAGGNNKYIQMRFMKTDEMTWKLTLSCKLLLTVQRLPEAIAISASRIHIQSNKSKHLKKTSQP